MSRTLSAQGLSEVGVGLMDRLKGMGSRADSFADLPMGALPGLTSRVSISGSTSPSCSAAEGLRCSTGSVVGSAIFDICGRHPRRHAGSAI